MEDRVFGATMLLSLRGAGTVAMMSHDFIGSAKRRNRCGWFKVELTLNNM
jgi:hypothetical protein